LVLYSKCSYICKKFIEAIAMTIKRLILMLTLMLNAFAFANTTEKPEAGGKQDPVESIMHHIADSHTWHFWGEGHDAVSLNLPIILWDNGLQVFSSERFIDENHETNKVAESNGNFYKMVHEKIYKTDAAGKLDEVEEEGGKHSISNEKPLDFSITKIVAQILLAFVILLVLGLLAAKSYKKSQVPTGVARLIEPLVLFVRDDIALQNIGHVKYKKFTPYLVSLFLFIWLLNILGLIPGSANVTGNIAITLVLALFTMIIVNTSGNKTYWMHILDPLGNSMPVGGKILVYIILIPVELLGIITKPFALMMRLFANMAAGHIVILSLISLIYIIGSYAIVPVSVALTLFINVLEVLVAALQAYVFTLLTSLFIGMAVEEPHHH
jgi:F-type H+-transporting ATPase subunit a